METSGGFGRSAAHTHAPIARSAQVSNCLGVRNSSNIPLHWRACTALPDWRRWWDAYARACHGSPLCVLARTG
eukprot:15482418-Alexandrium_andersonii.AAC.1